MRLFLLLVLLVSLFLPSSCKKYQPADATFFIRASKVSVSPVYDGGSTSNKITDLWLYVNGKYQGAYPVGNLMPIISNNSPVRLNIFAGITNNGIADTRIFYPFYDFLTIDTLVENGKTIERSFIFKYKSATTFTWTENFDNGISSTLQRSGTSIFTVKSISNSDAFENRSLEVDLNTDTMSAQLESSNSYYLPQSSSNVYLELNYKCDAAFTVGLIGDDGSPRPALVVNAQPNWNKIHIQLSTAVSSQPPSLKFKVYFLFLKTDTETRRFFLDNIKLLYL
jgi:hypothetical protein